jgi:hypothetical protein
MQLLPAHEYSHTVAQATQISGNITIDMGSVVLRNNAFSGPVDAKSWLPSRFHHRRLFTTDPFVAELNNKAN